MEGLLTRTTLMINNELKDVEQKLLNYYQPGTVAIDKIVINKSVRPCGMLLY